LKYWEDEKIKGKERLSTTLDKCSLILNREIKEMHKVLDMEKEKILLTIR
jgi:hypothetical protein